MHWTDALHRQLVNLTDTVNRLDVDTRLLAASEVKLDRALFPLLSRLGLHPPMSVMELANLVGRDHSTVSRQIDKLETLGLVERRPDSRDGRARILMPSVDGYSLLQRVAAVRRQWIETHFADWPPEEIDRLIALMSRMVAGGEEECMTASRSFETPPS